MTLARQLGALVFTYNGENAADTALRFAQEYRVGHIVMGRPGPVPKWKRLFGKRSLVELIIEACRGATIVVLDTRRDTEEEGRAPLPEVAQFSTQTVSDHRPRAFLSDYVLPHRIVVWKYPVSKRSAIRRPVEVAAADSGGLSPQVLFERIMERKSQSSTFLNEGVAFPHTRIEEIRSPILAPGIPCEGITDAGSGRLTNLVFLILTPAEDPDLHVRLLSPAAHAARNADWIESRRKAPHPQDVYNSLRTIEAEKQGN